MNCDFFIIIINSFLMRYINKIYLVTHLAKKKTQSLWHGDQGRSGASIVQLFSSSENRICIKMVIISENIKGILLLNSLN